MTFQSEAIPAFTKGTNLNGMARRHRLTMISNRHLKIIVSRLARLQAKPVLTSLHSIDDLTLLRFFKDAQIDMQCTLAVDFKRNAQIGQTAFGNDFIKWTSSKRGEPHQASMSSRLQDGFHRFVRTGSTQELDGYIDTSEPASSSIELEDLSTRSFDTSKDVAGGKLTHARQNV